MDDIDEFSYRIKRYAVDNASSPFDKLLPEETVRLPIQTRRIIYRTTAAISKIIKLQKANKYHDVLFCVCAVGLQSDWFNAISERSRPTYFHHVQGLFDWINELGNETAGKNRYKVLKEYEAYYMNDRGRKSTPLSFINPVIREGLGCPSFTKEEHNYLETLLSLSRPAKAREPKLVSLSSWFDLPWMRSVIGEQAYLKLESPRLLFQSFRVTIATTLLWLLARRIEWQAAGLIAFDADAKRWQDDWNRLLLERMGNFNERGDPEDEFSQILLLDLVLPSAQSALKSQLATVGTKNLPNCISYGKSSNPPWQKPVFFHPNYQSQYSPLEEILCAWLVACEAIQPSDIPSLKSSNYARETNHYGRLIALECTYYKGRAGTTKQPAILMASDSWTKAMDAYMAGLAEPSLFKTGVAKSVAMTGFGRMHTFISLLYKIWKLPSFLQKLESELQRTNSTSLFLRAMFALEEGDSRLGVGRHWNSVTEFRASVPRPLPVSLFTLTHIKTTAVHAGTDAYREADIVNHHSHTSLTEKTSYLTDNNKEWVNQAGRITRLILHDLQNVVFQPSITVISQAVIDLELRTKLIDATQTMDLLTYSLKGNLLDAETETGATIIVSDSIDAALYFIHYIKQAEALLPRILVVRPGWVERTLIVQVEWMTRTLSRMQMASTAAKAYVELAEHLPPLFDHLLEITE